MRSPTLFATFEDACRGALEFALSRETRPNTVVWKKKPDRTLEKELIWRPTLHGLSIRGQERLHAQVWWKAFNRVLLQTPIVSEHFTSGFVVGRDWHTLNPLGFQQRALGEFLRRSDSKFDGSTAESVYVRLEDFFFEDSLPFRVVAPVVGVELGSGCRLNTTTGIEELSVEDGVKVQRPAGGEILPNSALVATFHVQKAIQRATLAPSWRPGEVAERIVEAFEVALEQVSAGSASVPAWVLEPARFAPAPGPMHRSKPLDPARTMATGKPIKTDALFAAWREADSIAGVKKPSPPPVEPRRERTLDRVPDSHGAPRVPFVAVFPIRAEVDRRSVAELKGMSILVVQELTFEYAAASANAGPGFSTMSLEPKKVVFDLDRGPYLVLSTETDLSPQGRTQARLSVAEARTLIELAFPDVLGNRLFEGIVGSGVWEREGPFRMSAAPIRNAEAVVEGTVDSIGHVQQLSEADRTRFRRAAIWYGRGRRAVNEVDRLLYFWIVLEIHPGHGTTDIPRRVAEYIRSELGRTEGPTTVKMRLRLAGKDSLVHIRNQVVHDGLPFPSPYVDSIRKANSWSEALACLEATAATCLRLLAGLPPGTHIDRYLDDPILGE